ncbi:CBO0543 family protein [Virgibacillus kekensis]|uniref:CBO0543 family protein n=1 Tax=Virgibacillus kekensis TaxID=202261 RepID=A0ABV9DJK2_9BACI
MPLAAYRWGDWRNWRLYYPTILFYVLSDLFYNYALFQYPMWRFHDGPIPLFHYEFFIVLSFLLLRYPATVLIYLGRFPSDKWKAVGWILFWVALYLAFEAFDYQIGLISYDNGWHIGWSLLFNLVLFSMLKIHYHRPLLAWALSAIWIVTLWNIPLEVIIKD